MKNGKDIPIWRFLDASHLEILPAATFVERLRSDSLVDLDSV